MNDPSDMNWHTPHTYLGRQPIFDASTRVKGHELLYRADKDAPSALFENGEDATLSVIQESYATPFVETAADTFIMINFTMPAILNNAPYALPPYKTVLKIAYSRPPTPAQHKALQNLRREGYYLAVDRQTADCTQLGSDMDICIVDGLEGATPETLQQIRKLQDAGVTVMAKRIEHQAVFAALQAEGVELFQGFFFQKPETIQGTQLASNQVLRLKILQLLHQEDPDLDQLATVVEQEVSLTYRVLRYVNSVHCSPLIQINSIRHALTYMGSNQLRHLLQLFLLRDLTPQGKTSALPFYSALRAKFFETLAKQNAYAPHAEHLFLLGLLSLLEAIFDQPMSAVLAHLPLNPEVKAALEGKTNHYTPWLELIQAYEQAHWEQVDRYVERLELSPAEVAVTYAQTMQWTRDFFEFAV
ncbi:MAG: EAL and HDOD domain-containing protein [Thermodesulfobacteriota bacterium]